jgi:3-hydroxyisobutyrate dehydrogenase-like beta-hydroxyacid dehydrogenase
MENTMPLGFIGVGNIDTPMCRHLIEIGHTIMAHDVRRATPIALR